MTLESLREFVSNHVGQSLLTIQNYPFMVSEQGGSFVFEVAGSKPRRESFGSILEGLEVFNVTGSLRTKNYDFPRNSSYVLGLFLAAKNWLALPNLDADITAILSDTSVDPTMRSTLVSTRIGQGGFRDDVLNAWGSKCAVTGSTTLRAIRASHIKPWRESSITERLDPKNGIPLIANLDALFDVGLVSFDQYGGLIVSSTMSEAEVALFGLAEKSLSQRPCAETSAYLEFHRSTVFVR